MSITHEHLDFFLRGRGVRYFSAREVAQRALPHRSLWQHIMPTLWFAERLRDRFGVTIVSSGYRDAEHNREAGGGSQSLHLSFNALDLTPRTGTPEDWGRHMSELGLRLFGGLGVYHARNFIHIDTRGLALGKEPWYKEYHT